MTDSVSIHILIYFMIQKIINICTLFLPDKKTIFSIFPIFATLYVAKQARNIAQKSKDISEVKLTIDVFDKRFKVVDSYNKIFSQLLSVSIDPKKIQDYLIDFQQNHIYHEIFFPNEYDFVFIQCALEMHFLATFRSENTDLSKYDETQKIKFREITGHIRLYMKFIRNLLSEATPNALRVIDITSATKASLESLRKPQPTAPAADQSPPTP